MRPIVKKVLESFAGLPDEAPWLWLSFADASLPKGRQWLGCAVVRAHNVGHAAMIAHQHGCNPGGEVQAMTVHAHLGDPPAELNHKLIRDRVELDRLTKIWTSEAP